jgi:hypothetical protein
MDIVDVLKLRVRMDNELAVSMNLDYPSTFNKGCLDEITSLRNQLALAKEQLAGCQKDAERCRWLRGMIYDDRMLHGKELDEVIDQAMSEKG